MTTAQTCPRRTHEMGPWEREEGLDSWTTGHGVIGQDSVGLSCSFCGSLHPDKFMALVREGWIVGPTDKTYKVYLSRPLTDEEKAQRKERWMAGFSPEEIQATASKRGETPEQAKAALETAYELQVAQLEGAHTEAKFYFQHLSEDQRREFVDLYNSRQMKVGYPGHFYQPPFFMRPVPGTRKQEERE
ncbi:hypothetical protein [Streptomyces sp. WAC 06738]|uniref:hypothetical protein n=1 Tax=Streptomyces sp. WAC 06738 TaxID=2203210 RepID=UPI000F7662F9|nr:hypothetical protein [Streptomyces sp. WAC 06738]